jgi:hypothetical protein
MDDYHIERSVDLSEQFGRFLHFSDGTYIALWFHDGMVPNAGPVVELGSEGDLKVLAPNLKSLFTTWANGPFHQEVELTEEECTPERIAQRERYGEKLLEFAQSLPEHRLGVPAPNLEHLMEQQSKTAFVKFAVDPTLQAILSLMDAHIPTAQEIGRQFWINVAGPRIEICDSGTPESDCKIPILFSECEALIPLILKAREERAALPFVARGLWHAATLALNTFQKSLI